VLVGVIDGVIVGVGVTDGGSSHSVQSSNSLVIDNEVNSS